ncbi:MAG: PAS domain S-box protein [Burkholderiales bacterium]
MRVLLIEDDRASAMVIQGHLAAIGSARCQVEVAASFGAALERLASGRFDLVISDLHLPDSPGPETIARLVAVCHHPVIALTIDEDPELRARALASGAFDFLIKGRLGDGGLERPVRLAALQARMMHSLRSSEARLRAIVNAEPECVALLDGDSRLVEINPAGLQMMEAEAPEALRGHPMLQVVAAEYREAFASLVRRAAGGEAGSLHFEVIGLRGTRRWLETRVVPLRDETSGSDLVLGIARDISAQKRAEQALQASEERFRKLTELSSDWYWEQDEEFRLTFMSTLLEGKTGLAPSAYLGRRRWEQPALNLTPADWASHRALLERHEPFRDFEMQRQSPEGGSRWLSISGEPVFDTGACFKGYRGIGRDITERKRAEQALRESEARFRSLVELSSDFYWETDSEHRITVTTHPQKHPPASAPVLGKARWDLPSVLPDAAGWAAHRATLDARLPFRDFEIGRVDPEGEQRFLAISGEPMFGPAGEFLGYRGVGRDITERRREERLVTLEHAVARELADATGVGEALRGVMREICQTEHWDCGRYFMVDEAAKGMRCEEVWSSGIGELTAFAERSRGITLAAGEGLVGHVWQSGEPVWSADVRHDPRSALFARVREAGVHGALIFPVTFESRVVGVLSISSGAVRRPDARLLGTMLAIGAQIGQYLSRKRAEAALEESEARFRQTFEIAASGIAHVDLTGRFLLVNRRLCEMLGYSEAELIGRSVKDVSHPEDRDSTDAKRALMRVGGVASVQLEKRYLRKDGSVLWVNLTVALARNAHGEPQHEIAVMEDITGRKEREATLQRFRTALDSSADMVLLFELGTGRLLDFNDTACKLLGYSHDELLRLRAWDIRADVTADDLRAETENLLRMQERTTTVTIQYRRKDGSSFPVESHRSLLDTPQGRVLVVNARDLTERMSAERRRAAQARYQTKIARLGEAALSKRNAAELIAKAVRTVEEGLALGAVAYFERSASGDEIVLRSAAGLACGAHDYEAVRLERGGALGALWQGTEPIVVNGPWGEKSPLPFEWLPRYGALAAAPVPAEGGPRAFICALAQAPGAFGLEETRFLAAAASMVAAALQRLESEARLAYLAQFDALTGLPNRALLADRFSMMIVQARRRGASLGVLFIDLDDFKLVNDTQGHAAGDILLKEAAKRLQSAVRDGDTVARISGDEFAIILSDLARPDDAALVAQKIIERLSAPADIDGQEVVVTASIGIATFPADGDNAEALLGAADAAMYRAKQSGRNAFQFFTAEINQRTRVRAHMGLELRRALERKEFTLVYQPKFDLASGEPCGAEALLRWDHPERGRVTPAEFIPVLEETGLIVPVGEWVLRRACEDLKTWLRLGAPAMPVAVNLSARQFRQPDLEERIRAIVSAAGIAPSLIELEITESQLMHDPDHAIRVLHALGEAGVRIAIDDFGTGYSSLAYLTRFPLASLKIDRSFVADVLDDEADATIVRTIIDMAHTLGFTVIAEGVERESQAAFLRALGCEQAQGFLFARPMSSQEFVALVLARLGGAAGVRHRRAARKAAKP